MVKGVAGDFVPGGRQFAQSRRNATGDLAEDEESRPGAAAGELLGHHGQQPVELLRQARTPAWFDVFGHPAVVVPLFDIDRERRAEATDDRRDLRQTRLRL